MSIVGDIIAVAKGIEGRVKDRQDIDALRKIHSLALSLQKEHSEIVDRADRVQRESMEAETKAGEKIRDLERQLTAAKEEDKRIHMGIDFRKSKRTGGQWQPFCPKCGMPVKEIEASGALYADCSANCEWGGTEIDKPLVEISKNID